MNDLRWQVLDFLLYLTSLVEKDKKYEFMTTYQFFVCGKLQVLCYILYCKSHSVPVILSIAIKAQSVCSF